MQTKYKNILYYLCLGLIFLLGIFLRTKMYFISNVFEDDECRLAITLLDKNMWQMFLPLLDAQSAPPLFLCVEKFITYIFGYKEQAMIFVPYAAGILNLFMIYKLASSYFKKRISVLISVFIFAMSGPLILFSTIFKQYSTDVLTGLLCLYYLPKINIKELNLKKHILLGMILIILPFVSLPSLFFIGAFFILNFKDSPKRIISLLAPFVIVMSAYYFFNLAPSKANLDYVFPDFWVDGFLSLSFKDFIRLMLVNIKFDFIPNTLSLFSLILLFWGAVLCVLERTNKTSIFILTTACLVLLASFINVYPLLGRVGLYSISMFLLLMLKPLDTYDFKHPAFAVALICVILSFCQYDFAHIKHMMDPETRVKYSSRHLLEIIKEKYNPKTDAIICNSASTASYIFYSSKLEFYPENAFEMRAKPDTHEAVFKYLNSLKKGQKFWFYLVKDYSMCPIRPFILEWAQEKEILYIKKERDSAIIYLQN